MKFNDMSHNFCATAQRCLQWHDDTIPDLAFLDNKGKAHKRAQLRYLM